ncbi:MAG: site-specific DNA-methyltransferase [Flavobacteriaceae bacterium]|nr:site-specific DNA-methyltransferase [Flavobacteriaceae bacterium]
MDGTSLTPEQEKLNTLKQVLPEAFTEGKIDWEKLKATLGEEINFSNERYVLNWAGKSEAFKALQAPTSKTLVPAKNESVNFDDTEHIFIEGENLEVLKVLQKSYFGKVKMIYIDPPYNTGNDFVYNDSFAEKKADYQKRVGDKDEDGNLTKDAYTKNSKENGQYHSNWLNMMMPRLYLAKNLLRQDGVIFVSIDDNEVHNLRLLMNEIFGEENFVAEMIWQKGAGTQNDNKFIAINHEYILCFTKQKESINFYNLPPSEEMLRNYNLQDEFVNERGKHTLRNLNDFSIGDRPGLHYDIECPDGTILNGIEHRWRCDIHRFKWRVENKRIVFEKNKEGKWQVFYKQYLFEKKEEVIRDKNGNLLSYGRIPNSLLANIVFTGDGKKEINELFENEKPFDYPKPTKLINHLITISTKNDDLILDFFAGSGTTAHAVIALNAQDGGNRKSISVQLPEQCDEKSEAHKAGYKTIADIAKERIRRASSKIKDDLGLQIEDLQSKINTLKTEIPTDETIAEIKNLQSKISNLKSQDLGFKVLKLADSNFKQWQQITGKDKQALEEQMKLFVDPVAKNATTENMVYELLLKSGKDLNSTISHVSTGSTPEGFYAINETELVLVLEKANQEIIDAVIASKPQKVIALDKLFKDNDQLKTNASLQMKDAGIEFKTI